MKKNENINAPGTKKRVLVAPLDWGLGHATRCIPLIFKLLQQNCEVVVAAEGEEDVEGVDEEGPDVDWSLDD